MTQLTASAVEPTNITIQWQELTDTTLNGGDVPIFYSIEWSSDS